LCDRLLANLPLAVPALPPFIIPAKIAAVASPESGSCTAGARTSSAQLGQQTWRKNALISANKTGGNA
jgi:hypothetical protein